MKSRIIINKIIPYFDFKTIDDKYDIFCLTASNDYIKDGAMIIDTPLLEKSVKSVLFEGGKKLYLLIEHDANNRNKIKKILTETKSGSTLSYEKLSSRQLSERCLLQLFLNGLASKNHPLLRFNNITGHLYIFKPDWIDKNSKDNSIWKIKTLEIQILENLAIRLTVKTFVSTKLKNKITFGKRKLEEYPKYVLSNTPDSIKRKTSEDKNENENIFIMRQEDNKKSSIAFLDIGSNNVFESSKVGAFIQTVDEFNSRYSGMLSVEFEYINEYKTIESKHTKAENDKAVESFLSNKSIRIVDGIQDDYSKRCCDEIADLINKNYSVKAKVGVRLNKEALNIRLIHNKEYYIKNNIPHDPHQDKLNGYTVQHITFEDFMSVKKFAINTVIHELIIKDDIHKGKFSLYDWSTTELDKIVSFGYSTKENIPRYFFMNVLPDGTFDFSEQKNDLFSFNEYSTCMQIFDDDNTVVGIIKYTEDDILVIRNTNLFTLPEMSNLHDELKSGNTYLRNEIARNQYLTAITEIRAYKRDGKTFYFAGITGSGMQSKVQRASLIREVSQAKNGNSDFMTLLPLMNVSFVRNGQLTVIPFPFKYLKEYIQNVMKDESK